LEEELEEESEEESEVKSDEVGELEEEERRRRRERRRGGGGGGELEKLEVKSDKVGVCKIDSFVHIWVCDILKVKITLALLCNYMGGNKCTQNRTLKFGT